MSFVRVARGWMISSTKPRDGRDERVRELLAELGDELRAQRRRIGRLRQLAPVEDVHRALRPHHRDLGRRIRVVEVRADVLARHHAVRAAVRLARDDGDLRHRRFGERVEQLRAGADDAAVLLPHARQEARHVLERDERDVERVAEAHEARGLHRRVDVETPGEHRRLIGDDADRPAAQPREADDDVLREVPMHFEERAVVDDGVNQIVDVVRLVRLLRHQPVERVVFAIDRIGRRAPRRIVEVVRRQVAEQLADRAGGTRGRPAPRSARRRSSRCASSRRRALPSSRPRASPS